MTPTEIPPRIRIARLGAVLGLVTATATLLVWLLLWLAPPGPACLVLAGAGYEDNLAIPVNPQGREAMSLFARLVGTSSPLSSLFRQSGRVRLVRPPQDLTRGGDWSRGLDGFRERSVLIFLPLHGAADYQGAYLLPQDAGPSPDDRLRLDKILDRISEMPADRHKLLILDATGFSANWPMGVLNNDFARALADLEERIVAIPNLVVVSSSGPDQRSWPTANLRTSLFARHLLEGLAGQADARQDAWRLFTHVSRQVTADARRIHGVVQTPVLLPRQGGEERARAMRLTFQLDETALEEEPGGDPLPEIEAAWAAYQAFRPRASAARACVPRDWQTWQAWLVRHEQLRLARSPLAGSIAEKAREAGDRVRAGLDLALVSGQATLAMPAVQGETQLEVPDPYPPLEDLWQTPPPDQRTVWQRLQKSNAGPLLRRNLQFALVRRAAENPARNLLRAADLTQLIDDPVRITRPAESHFLVMARRDLVTPTAIPADLNGPLAEGLRLRLIAEQRALAIQGNSYAYSERIKPWIASAIEKADRLRQDGQDLLFASDRTHWQEAHEKLSQAATLYGQVGDDVKGLQPAMTTCDRALLQLPILAGWLAALPGDPDDALLNKGLELFAQVRRLEQMLAEVRKERDTGKLAKVHQEAEKARLALDEIQDRLDASARTCESSSSFLVRDAGPLLEVPWLAWELRQPLLRKLGRLARKTRWGKEADVAVDPNQQSERQLRRAVREGRLALAALGKTWFDQDVQAAPPAGTKPAGAHSAALARDHAPYSDVETFVRRPDVEINWSRVLSWAGDQVGARFRQYAVKVDQLVDQCEKTPASADEPLHEADRLSRRLDAGQWQGMRRDAPALLRKREVEQLLVWQADRTWRDHWYNDDPTGRPFYQLVGQDFLRDADRLHPFGHSGAPDTKAMRARINGHDGLRIAPGDGQPIQADGTLPPRHLIAGDRLEIRARLTSLPGSLVTGYPVMWASRGDRLTFASPTDAGRTVVRVSPGDDVSPFSVTLSSPELLDAEKSPPADASPRQTEMSWRGFYRGQKPGATTPIYLHPVAEITRIDHPPPGRAAIAVRGVDPLFARYGRAQGSLAIVMDCSGSEGAPGDQATAETRSRFRLAIRALRRVLGVVPQGTRVSLWIFGQAVPPRNAVERAEETIQRLREPGTWNGESDVEGLVAQVEAQRPFNESPIARTILRAREDLASADGFRVMVVISDGDDNRFSKDRESNPKNEPIPDVLRRRFKDTDIVMHVAGFMGKGDKPEPELESNFGFVTDRMPRGTLTTVDRLDPLLAALRREMRRGLNYRLSAQDADTFRSANVQVTRSGENDHWLTVPGSRDGYQFQVSDMSFDRRVSLRDGDGVLLRLDESANQWRRLIYSRQDPFALRPFRATGGWRAAVLQNQLLDSQAIQMMLTVEKESPQSEDVGQVQPGPLWVEMSPGDSRDLPAVRWGRLYGYPAPAWSIDAAGWPNTSQGPASPRLSVWWETPGTKSSLLMRRPGDFRDLANLKGEKKIGEESFEVLKLQVEQHWVQAEEAQRQRRWCLVLDTSHAIGKPIFARLEGLTRMAGQEHRQFESAGRYVALTWFSDAASQDEVRRKVERELTAVRFVSVTAFKKEAQAQMQSATFTNLDVPAPVPPRPRPVWSPR